MAFRTNSAKANEGGSIKEEGFYEVLIEDAGVRTLPNNGKQKVGFKYVVRNDIEQKYKNGYIFHDIWKKKEPNEDDMQVDGFNFAQLMAISKAVRIPDDKEFENINDFLKALIGKPIKVHLFHDEYNGKTYEKIDKHYPTEFSEVKHKPKEKPAKSETFAAQPAATTKSDDDYPF